MHSDKKITYSLIKITDMKTITGREIKATPNLSKRTFTIRTGDGYKYRTTPMTQEEFDSNLNNTANDWAQFLKSDDYYTI